MIPSHLRRTKKRLNRKTRRGNTPQFSDFPAGKISTGTPAHVDLSSHPLARMFRTRLRKGTSEGPNFAGHYALVSWGCGNECQQLLVVDVRTGKVYGEALTQIPSSHGDTERINKGVVQMSRGVEFAIDSRLLWSILPVQETTIHVFHEGGLKNPYAII